MMEDFLCEIEEHFLFGTLTVFAVRRQDGSPVLGLKARIGSSIEEACGKG
jgi:hypothetical protein